VSIVAHSGKFDVLWLVSKGLAPDGILDVWTGDTQLSAFVHTNKIDADWLAVYDANKPPHVRPASLHSLKTLAPYFLGVPSYWEPEHGHDDDEYVLKDVEYTLRLHDYFEANMTQEEKDFVSKKLLPWTKMLVEAELRGLKLDVAGLEKLRSELEKEVGDLKAKLDVIWEDGHKAYCVIQARAINAKYDAQKLTKTREQRRFKALSEMPTMINYDSPSQMKWLLGEFLGYDLMTLDGKGESTGKEVLNRLAEAGHEDISIYSRWRKSQKILTAFIPSLLALRDKDDIIHPIYNATGARTGRTSSERPNAQQIPSLLKPYFKPREGKLIGYDQSAIEAKLIAAYTEDPELWKIIESGESIHNVNTVAFFGLDCPPDKVPALHPKRRKAAKNVGFAGFYNAGANRFRIAFTQAGFPVSQMEAKAAHRGFCEKYSVAMSFGASLVSSFEAGEVIPNLLQRPIKITDPADAYMTGFNTLVQSSASDINLDRMYSALTRLRKEGFKAYPLLTIHDYAGIEVIGTEEQVSRADKIVKEELTNFSLSTTRGEIKLEVEGGIEDYWN